MAKRRIFQISLRSFLLLFFVVGISGGIWQGMINPVRQQWLAVEPILAMGGQVETNPSNVPKWLKFLLEDGKTENIKAVDFKCAFSDYAPSSRFATDETIEALKHLPHLRRLDLEHAQLKPKHIDTIVKLAQLEYLDLSGNQKLSAADLRKLTCLKNLNFLDIGSCGGDWRTLLAFQKEQRNIIQHSFHQQALSSITSADIDDRLLIKQFLDSSRGYPTMKGAEASTLAKVRRLAPLASTVAVKLTDEVDLAFLKEFYRLKQEKPFQLYLTLDDFIGVPLSTQAERLANTIGLIWKEYGSLANELVIETNSGPASSSHLILRSAQPNDAFAIDVYFDGNMRFSSDGIETLPDLPNIQSVIFSHYRGNQIQLAGLETLLHKIPNVTQVKVENPEVGHQAFWRPLSQLKNIRKLSINTLRLGPLDALPNNFPDDFELRDTLTHFTMDVYYPKENEIANLIKALPNLESFMHLGEEMLKHD